MSPEAQKVAIAKVCGWKFYDQAGKTSPQWVNPSGLYDCMSNVPDYPNDLNAIHKAEKLIMDESSIEYLKQLNKVSCPWHASAKATGGSILEDTRIMGGKSKTKHENTTRSYGERGGNARTKIDY